MVQIEKQGTTVGQDSGTASVVSTLVKRKLFNHDIMNCTADGVVGNHLYAARALGMTERHDMIQLPAELKTEWAYIQKHYQRIGLTHTEDVIWNTSLKEFSLNKGYEPSMFFFGPREHYHLNHAEWFDAVKFINSKNNFMALADELDVPVPRTICFDQASEVSAEKLSDMSFPCYLKAAISVSGVGIYRCENMETLLASAANFAPSTPVQIQQEVVTDCFLNMQYQVVDGECKRLMVTEQILDGPAHQGNKYPARAEPWDAVEPMAQWLAEKGLKDIFAFDVAVVETPAGPEYVAIECNPRYNGASYPTAIAMKLGIDQWEARNYKTWRKTLSSIDLSGLEYNQETGEGAIIVNWGPISFGKIMLMLSGSEPVRRELEVEIKHRLW